jgi:excisionase family DNA binding protein
MTKSNPKETVTHEKPLNTREAAEYLGITKGSLYQLMYRHEVDYHKPGGKKAFFKVSDLDRYAYRNRVASRYSLEEEAEKILACAGRGRNDGRVRVA